MAFCKTIFKDEVIQIKILNFCDCRRKFCMYETDYSVI